MAFIVVYFNAVCAKPLSSEMPFLHSQAFNQFSQGQDSQPVVDAIEPEESITEESNYRRNGNGNMENSALPTQLSGFNFTTALSFVDNCDDIYTQEAIDSSQRKLQKKLRGMPGRDLRCRW